MRSPIASQGEGGALGEEEARKRGNTVGIRDQAMDIAKLNGHDVSRAERNLFPTPKALDGIKGNLKSSQERLDSGHQVDLPNVAIDLLGTPRTSSANGSSPKQVEAGAPKARLEDQVHTNWGRFEPAVKRWEEILGRPAPFPTKPDGKDGAHRLSSAFTEWMMGLPEGWITDVGLTRNEELRACGNGVVPQQAELALRMLLEGISAPRGSEIPMLPTATPSDAYIGDLKSVQRKPGSMHSVNLAVAVDGIRKGEM